MNDSSCVGQLSRIDGAQPTPQAHSLEFNVSELEREPIDFDLELVPGAVDFGEEAEEAGQLATAGRAAVPHEHRGPRDIVADIRLFGLGTKAIKIASGGNR